MSSSSCLFVKKKRSRYKEMAAVRELLLAAFLLVLAIMLTVFACTLIQDHNAYPLLPLMFYAFTPVPAFLCIRKSGSGGFSSGGSSSAFDNMGHFFLGLFATSGPCMAAVLYHTEKMTLDAMLMCFGTAVLLAGSGYVLHRSLSSSRENDGF